MRNIGDTVAIYRRRTARPISSKWNSRSYSSSRSESTSIVEWYNHCSCIDRRAKLPRKINSRVNPKLRYTPKERSASRYTPKSRGSNSMAVVPLSWSSDTSSGNSSNIARAEESMVEANHRAVLLAYCKMRIPGHNCNSRSSKAPPRRKRNKSANTPPTENNSYLPSVPGHSKSCIAKVATPSRHSAEANCKIAGKPIDSNVNIVRIEAAILSDESRSPGAVE